MAKKSRTYSQMQNELGEIINWFESDSFDLEEALNKYNEANKLVNEIKQYLTEAENKVSKLKPVSKIEK
jgi:exodeoxyribonuclease VII small subunit